MIKSLSALFHLWRKMRTIWTSNLSKKKSQFASYNYLDFKSIFQACFEMIIKDFLETPCRYNDSSIKLSPWIFIFNKLFSDIGRHGFFMEDFVTFLKSYIRKVRNLKETNALNSILVWPISSCAVQMENFVKKKARTFCQRNRSIVQTAEIMLA